MARRGLFSLVATPFLPSSRLLTTTPALSDLPASDPIAATALRVWDDLATVAALTGTTAGRNDRRNGPVVLTDGNPIDGEIIDRCLADLAASEARLTLMLADVPGLTVAVGDRVYSAGGETRGTVICRAVRLAMLAPRGGVYC
jgi:hypothetical protein